jgi:hypothetical protein
MVQFLRPAEIGWYLGYRTVLGAWSQCLNVASDFYYPTYDPTIPIISWGEYLDTTSGDTSVVWNVLHTIGQGGETQDLVDFSWGDFDYLTGQVNIDPLTPFGIQDTNNAGCFPCVPRPNYIDSDTENVTPMADETNPIWIFLLQSYFAVSDSTCEIYGQT